jgi:hypothetical protein
MVNLPFPFILALFARIFAPLLDLMRQRKALFERDLVPVAVGVTELHQLLKLNPHLVGDRSLMELALVDLGMPMPQRLNL